MRGEVPDSVLERSLQSPPDWEELASLQQTKITKEAIEECTDNSVFAMLMRNSLADSNWRKILVYVQKPNQNCRPSCIHAYDIHGCPIHEPRDGQIVEGVLTYDKFISRFATNGTQYYNPPFVKRRGPTARSTPPRNKDHEELTVNDVRIVRANRSMPLMLEERGTLNLEAIVQVVDVHALSLTCRI